MSAIGVRADKIRFWRKRGRDFQRKHHLLGFSSKKYCTSLIFIKTEWDELGKYYFGADFKEEIPIMSDQSKNSSTILSRRSALLQGAMCVTGVVTILATNIDSAKAAKLPQKSVGYRPTPNADRECSNCKIFVAPDECEKVDGKVSPQGYCVLWQKV